MTFGAGKAFCGYLMASLYASFQRKEPRMAVDVGTGQRSDRTNGPIRGHPEPAGMFVAPQQYRGHFVSSVPPGLDNNNTRKNLGLS